MKKKQRRDAGRGYGIPPYMCVKLSVDNGRNSTGKFFGSGDTFHQLAAAVEDKRCGSAVNRVDIVGYHHVGAVVGSSPYLGPGKP